MTSVLWFRAMDDEELNSGAIQKEDIDFKECVRCNICESKLIEKEGVCRHDLEKVQQLIQIKRGQHHKHQHIPQALHGD